MWLALAIASWAVPLGVSAVLAWFRPNWATVAGVVLTAAVVGVSVWAAAAHQAWTSSEDQHGPVRTIAGFALAVPFAALG